MRAPRLTIGKLFLLSLLFAAVFAGTYFSVKGAAMEDSIENEVTSKVFVEYGYALGAALAVLFFAWTLVLIGLKNLLGMKRFVCGNALLAIIPASAIAWFGWFLVFHEPRNTEVARAIIDFSGRPTFYSASAVAMVAFLFFVLALVGKTDAPDSKPTE